MNFDNELYLTDSEMQYEIENTQGLEIIKETDDYFEVVDNYQGVQRKVILNKEHNIATNNMIELFNDADDKYRVLEFLQMLPKILFMNVNKIYIVSSSDDLSVIEDSSELYGFDIWNKGMYVWEDGNIIISLLPHEHDVEYMADADIDMEFDDNVQISIWKTISRELFHALQSNPLFDGEIEQGEVVVEEYVNMLFQPSREVLIDSIERV